MTDLRGPLVAAGLKADLSVPTGLDLVVGEVALVLLRHLGSDHRALVLGVLLGGPPQREQAQGHLQHRGRHLHSR